MKYSSANVSKVGPEQNRSELRCCNKLQYSNGKTHWAALRRLETQREEMCDLNRSVSRSRSRRCSSICPQAARHSVTAAFIIDFITTISQPLKITLWSLDITLCRTLFLRPRKLSATVHAARSSRWRYCRYAPMSGFRKKKTKKPPENGFS